MFDRLTGELLAAFPDMRMYAEAWTDSETVRQAVAQWPWGDVSIVQQLAAQLQLFHNVLLLNKLKEAAVREWYAGQVIERRRDGRELTPVELAMRPG